MQLRERAVCCTRGINFTPAHRLRDGNEEVVGLLVDGGVRLEEDAPIGADPKGPVHMVGLQFQLGEVPVIERACNQCVSLRQSQILLNLSCHRGVQTDFEYELCSHF